MTNRNDRIETLRQNGIDISNFFDLSLRIPLGATVTLNINGQQLVATSGFNTDANESIPCVISDGHIVPVNSNGNTVVLGGYTYSGESLTTDDTIIQNIMDSGYVFNSRTDGRFVCAQTFRMLNEKSYNIKTRQYEYGWDNYLRNSYGFMYQFDMMKDEVHKLARMERNNDTEFEKLSSFFTKEVIIATCEHYIRQLRKFVNKQKRRKCHGVPYVKLNKYGNVFVRDLNDKVFSKLKTALNNMNNCSNYEMLERHLKSFIKVMVNFLMKLLNHLHGKMHLREKVLI